jgi:transcriptional regulator with XRE-family HTH domain
MSDAPYLDWSGLVREAKRRRRADGLSQVGHAQLAGVSRDTLRAFDRYETSISVEKAIAILKVVGLVASGGEATRHAGFVRRAMERWTQLTDQLPVGAAARFPLGSNTADIAFAGDFDIDASRLLAILRALPSISGWSPFHVFAKPSLQPVTFGDEIECWLGREQDDRFFADAPHQDYWRLSTRGDGILIRGYQEDGVDSAEPGTFLDLVLPIWRVADVVEFVRLLSSHLIEAGAASIERVAIGSHWTGLLGRRMLHWAHPTRRAAHRLPMSSRVPHVESRIEVSKDELLEDDGRAIVALCAPLYNAFGVPGAEELIVDELAERDGRRAPRAGRSR